MKTITYDLESNKTFPKRVAHFTLVHTSPIIGILFVTESGNGNKKQIRKYAIREEEISEKHSRTFRCTKPGGKEYYHTSINESMPAMDGCDCKAFLSNKTAKCVHIQAMRGMILNFGVPND